MLEPRHWAPWPETGRPVSPFCENGHHTGCSAAWQRACFGSRRSPVQIRPARLVVDHGCGGNLSLRADVAQWQSPSLPSWLRGFDSRHPLHESWPSRHRDGPSGDRAPVAQRTEQEPSKLLVEGSNPSGGTGMASASLHGDRSSVWLERRVVDPEVAGSNPVGHPKHRVVRISGSQHSLCLVRLAI